MDGYLIRYIDILICINCRKWSVFDTQIFCNSDYDDIKRRNPYAGYKVYDLEEQLNGIRKKDGGNLGRFLPRKIREMVLGMDEVKTIMKSVSRDNKINDILS